MGEVYRARDTKLQRDVAIKILPEAFAHDSERLARFDREARTLASLNHPNIGQIHGLEESDGIKALVMELVEGPTLADRIAQGPIPLDEALPIAKQIAEALEAAHEQGIIHRDLKPANVKVRPDGTVKVLDFGLAKALEPASAGSTDATASPTITSPAMMTGVGVILGTAAYMSPEQAKGRAADKRSDVWAFGCVLYEMLTGARAFAGDDVSDTLAAVLRGEPDWRVLPSETPASIRRLLRRCLEKDRKRRLSDAADARLEIEEALTTPMFETSAAPAPSQGGWRRGALIAAAALAVGGVAAGGAVWTAIRPASARVTRTVIQTSGATALTISPRAAGSLAITPDGSRLVYTAASQLVVRRLDQFDSEALTGLGAPTQPFISPDGQWIGFFDGLVLKKVAIGGGPAVTVDKDNNPGGGPLGATWGTRRNDRVCELWRHWTEKSRSRWRRRGGDADDARPRAGRGEALLALVSAGRPGPALHDLLRGSSARDRRAGSGNRRQDRVAQWASRAVPAIRPPRVWDGEHASRCGVRPRTADGGRGASTGRLPGCRCARAGYGV